MALPGGPLEICFSFDTTVSMTQYIDEVKARLQSMVQKLQADIPGIRIALCAHGDYYFKEWNNKSPYEMIKLDFTNDVVALCEFIQKAEPTYGGDWEEFYEYVLKEARETLSWSVHTNKVFVLIGDAEAHSMDDECNLNEIDWRHEVEEFVKKGVTVYGTYCKTAYSKHYDVEFFKELAKLGGGSFLKIQDFEDIFDTLMAICYREQGDTALEALELYEKEVNARQAKRSKDINTVFTTLKKSASNTSSTFGHILEQLNKAKAKTQNAISLKRKLSKEKATAVKRNTMNVKKASLSTKKESKQANKAGPKIAEGNKAYMGKTTGKKGPHQKSETIKLRRERVPETNFLLREFSWSSWKSAFSGSHLSKSWVKRQTGFGYRNDKIFKTVKNGTTLYEFSVVVKQRTRKVVVYRMYSKKEGLVTNVERHLKGKHIQSRLDNILKKGCTVYIRRLALNKRSVHRVVDSATKLYSYLWDQDCTRHFVKDDVEM